MRMKMLKALLDFCFLNNNFVFESIKLKSVNSGKDFDAEIE